MFNEEKECEQHVNWGKKGGKGDHHKKAYQWMQSPDHHSYLPSEFRKAVFSRLYALWYTNLRIGKRYQFLAAAQIDIHSKVMEKTMLLQNKPMNI